jgi:hypothetical protein
VGEVWNRELKNAIDIRVLFIAVATHTRGVVSHASSKLCAGSALLPTRRPFYLCRRNSSPS